ncbi:MAG: hypothetical protein PVS2B2_02460 [Candidatus Acidiferrum sp.]
MVPSFPMNALLSLHSVVVATSEQVSCSLNEESCILNLKNSVYYGLDPVGARVWDLLREPRPIREVLDTLLQEYDVAAQVCEQNLLDLLENLRAEGLIEVRGANDV